MDPRTLRNLRLQGPRVNLLPRTTPRDLQRLRENVPQVLLDRRIWVCTDRTPRHATNGSVAKSSKAPIGPHGSASVSDRATWLSFDEAAAFARADDRVGGLGICLTGRETVLDLDHVIGPAGLDAGARALLQSLPRTYIEVSPGGDGLHVLFLGPLPGDWRSVARDAFGEGTQLEGYSRARYIILTGHAVDGTERLLAPLPEQLPEQLCRLLKRSTQQEHQGEEVEHSAELILAALAVLDPDMSYPAWIEVGMALFKLRASLDDAQGLFEDWSSKGEKFAGADEIESKWSSFSVEADRKDRPGFGRLASMADATGKAWRPREELLFDDSTFVPPQSAKLPDAAQLYLNIADTRAIVGRQRFAVQGLLPATGMVQAFGPPSSGKSAWTLSMAFAFATNEPTFCGRAVLLHGPVALIVGEDRAGAAGRAVAECAVRGLDPAKVPIYISQMPTKLLDAADMARHAQAIINQCGRMPVLVIIDTTATNFGAGNEDSTEDMTLAMRNSITMQSALRCLFAFCHHTSKANKDTGRGSSAFEAALDGTFKITTRRHAAVASDPFSDDVDPLGDLPVAGRAHPTPHLVVVTPMKCRNWAQLEPITLRLVAVETGETVDGVAELGVTLQPYEAPQAGADAQPGEFPTELEPIVESVLCAIGIGGFTARSFVRDPRWPKVTRRNREDLLVALASAAMVAKARQGNLGTVWSVLPRGKKWLEDRVI